MWYKKSTLNQTATMQNNSLLDLTNLQTFVMIADSNSLTDAAKRLGVTQSAVSQSLKQLEATLGTELVVRRTQPVRLTAAGNVLKNGASNILGQLHRLNAQVRDAANTGLVQCRIGMVSSCSEVFSSQLIEKLSIQTEQLTIRSGTSPILLEAFMNREIDILICDEPLLSEQGLQRFKLFRDPMIAVIAESDLPASTSTSGKQIDSSSGAPSISIQEITEHKPLVKFSRNTHLGTYSEVVLRRMHLLTQVQYEADDTHTLTSFVKQGGMWAILSALSLAQVLDRMQGLRILELDKSRHSRDLFLVSRAGEMGEIPKQLADSFQTIFLETVLPQLQKHAQWMDQKQFEIDQITD